MNNTPTMLCERMKNGSEFNVSVDGKPPKYATKKMTAKIVPTPWAENKNVCVCFLFSLITYILFGKICI